MRRKLALVVTFAMIFSVPTAFSATPKVGGACTMINKFFELKSTLLVCATVKGKKTWRKATSVEKSLYLKEKNRLAEVAKVVPTPSSSPAPIANQDLNIQNINLAKSNGTYYQDTSGTFARFCQSSPMISALQARNQQQWQDVAPGRGWFSSPDNCFQPWTIYSATQDQILRWRVADASGYWQVFSQEFKGNKLPAQSTVAPTPTVTVAPTVAPISTPTPSATPTPSPTPSPTPLAAPASIPLYWVVYPNSSFCPNQSYVAEVGFGGSNGELVAGLSIQFSFNGNVFSSTTNKEGKASYSYTPNSSENRISVNASYAGGSTVRAVQSTTRSSTKSSSCG